MKFENPIMNISMFEVENVVTQASDPTPGPDKTAAELAEETGLVVEGKTIEITF